MQSRNTKEFDRKIQKKNTKELWLEIQKKIIGKEVYFKEHRSESTSIQAFADPELIGVRLKTETYTFHVNPSFYQGHLIPLEQALNMIRKFPNCNVVGRLAYYSGKLGIIDKRSILWIQDLNSNQRIPHIMIMKT